MVWKIVEFGGLVRGGGAVSCADSKSAMKSSSLVPESWLFTKGGNSLCYWPPRSCSSPVTTLVRRKVRPQIDWEVWSVSYVSTETISSYDVARDIVNGLSEATDIDEYISKRKSKEYGRGKRSPKKKAVTWEGEETCSILPSLPRDSSEEDSSPSKSPALQWRKLGSPQRKRSYSVQEGSRFASVVPPVPRTREIGCQTNLRFSDTASNERMDLMMRSINNLEQTVAKLVSKVISVDLGQKEMMDKLTTGFDQLQLVKERVEPACLDLPFQLPVRSFHEFAEVMAYAKKPEVLEQLMNSMSRVGGKTETSLINGILCRIMTNGFAKTCSWRGQRSSKHNLESSPLLTIVHGIAIRNKGFAHVTEEDVKIKIKDWVKQAGRRKESGLGVYQNLLDDVEYRDDFDIEDNEYRD
ncbi:uncharacterized protein LOC124164262 [Ischnura elegans]|uniref:uncharacterized protein LOC124164262 n=1 Tax=Ischnura elegans TaxID=197161 RepID=UPI001ED8BA23|nr:uncharacterized protein LOC124164262 [Ischnura elegans]